MNLWFITQNVKVYYVLLIKFRLINYVIIIIAGIIIICNVILFNNNSTDDIDVPIDMQCNLGGVCNYFLYLYKYIVYVNVGLQLQKLYIQ